jgi:hypothetical protein
MANTYGWGEFRLDSKPTADGTDFVVGVVHYRRTGTDDTGNFVDDTYGVIALPDPDPNNYIPFSEVTREIVIQWVEDILGAAPPQPEKEGEAYDPTTQLDRLNSSVDEKLAKFAPTEQVVTTTF